MNGVFITGGANGIGKATAEQLVEKGYKVIVYDRDKTALQDLPSAITIYHGDVYDEDRVNEVLAEEEFSVLVNCAGVQERGAIEDQSLDVVEEHFRSNVFGLLNVTRAALPMLREKQGRIINISSVAGKVSGPFFGAYAASKHAVEGLSDALRMEVCEFDVDVVVIEPGPIHTGFNERGRQMVKRYLPDSIYADRYRELLEPEHRGAPTRVAADRIVYAVETDRPRARYTVTRIAWIAPKLKTVLPTRLWDWLVRHW